MAERELRKNLTQAQTAINKALEVLEPVMPGKARARQFQAAIPEFAEGDPCNIDDVTTNYESCLSCKRVRQKPDPHDELVVHLRRKYPEAFKYVYRGEGGIPMSRKEAFESFRPNDPRRRPKQRSREEICGAIVGGREGGAPHPEELVPERFRMRGGIEPQRRFEGQPSPGVEFTSPPKEKKKEKQKEEAKTGQLVGQQQQQQADLATLMATLGEQVAKF